MLHLRCWRAVSPRAAPRRLPGIGARRHLPERWVNVDGGYRPPALPRAGCLTPYLPTHESHSRRDAKNPETSPSYGTPGTPKISAHNTLYAEPNVSVYPEHEYAGIP